MNNKFLFQLFLKLYEHQKLSIDPRKCVNSLGDERQEEESAAVGSVFQGVIQSLQDLKDHMIDVIREHVVQGFRMLSKPYKKEKWV